MHQEKCEAPIQLDSLPPRLQAASGAAAATQPASAADVNPNEHAASTGKLDRIGVTLLALQHASSSFGYRAAEFAFPLYFVNLFTDSLLPASIYGFVCTGAAIIFSGTVGNVLDGPSPRSRQATRSGVEADSEDKDPTFQLRAIRTFILAQKVLVGISYALFLVLFLQPGRAQEAEHGGRGTPPETPNVRPWTIFAAITLVGCGVILCNVGISVGIERAWVTLIARSEESSLIRLNAIMRRIDLLSKLLAPLFVSLLTSVAGYSTSSIILLAVTAATALFETIWLRIVFDRFPQLADWQQDVADKATQAEQSQTVVNTADISLATTAFARFEDDKHQKGAFTALRRGGRQEVDDWRRFAKMPIFISTCSIALLYLSVLSFESTFIAYLKSETAYKDGFIAGMRGVGVVAGLLGTMAMPYLEKLVGIVRAGSHSLFAQVLPLTMTLVPLYVGADQRDRPAWNGALLFSGIAISRIGLWSFDLAQLAQVQRALDRVERKNALMGLQFALQNFFDLGHYALTIGWHRPDQFRYAAAVSFGAVVCANFLYIVFYARRLRGHLVHLDRLGLDRLWIRKAN
ncbi:hypothetical protein V8E36_007358 [Tilletia maclaganii]